MDKRQKCNISEHIANDSRVPQHEAQPGDATGKTSIIFPSKKGILRFAVYKWSLTQPGKNKNIGSFKPAFIFTWFCNAWFNVLAPSELPTNSREKETDEGRLLVF